MLHDNSPLTTFVLEHLIPRFQLFYQKAFSTRAPQLVSLVRRRKNNLDPTLHHQQKTLLVLPSSPLWISLLPRSDERRKASRFHFKTLMLMIPYPLIICLKIKKPFRRVSLLLFMTMQTSIQFPMDAFDRFTRMVRYCSFLHFLQKIRKLQDLADFSLTENSLLC